MIELYNHENNLYFLIIIISINMFYISFICFKCIDTGGNGRATVFFLCHVQGE